MDFNLQAYQADHLLHLSAKPERRVSVLENARHRWLEMDGVVQSAMSLHQPARLCLPHQRSIAEQLPKQASRILELGLGARMVEDLEQLARDEKVKRLVMNARQEAVEFYRRCGFLEVGEGPVSFGRIPHRQMIKSLSPMQTIQYRPEWCQDLTTRWSRGIPISEKMGVHITHYDGQTFHLKANLAANLNVHDTMFAGSIYSQCVLAGWGLIWLQLKEAGLGGDTVLAEGNIKYYRPVSEEPEARVAREGMPAVLEPLRGGESAKFSLRVQLFSGRKLAVEFVGQYVVLPIKRGAR